MSVNVRSLNPDQLRVLLVLNALGFAVKAEVVAEARCETDGQASQALLALIRRELAEAGSFYEGRYGYRLTREGRACAEAA